MLKRDLDRLSQVLCESFGMTFQVAVARPGQEFTISIAPAEAHANEGFSIETTVGWRHATSRFVPGDFAADLVQSMGAADVVAKVTFCSIASRLAARKIAVALRVDGAKLSPMHMESWPNEWKSLDLELEGPPFDRAPGDVDRDVREVLLLSESALALVLCLAAEDVAASPTIEADAGVAGYPEGAVTRVLQNRYERDRRNRGLCIAAFGACCQACGLDFEQRYGEIGRGFIHVHHLVPVSRLVGRYVINPVTDLIPVCPNCHAMLHRADPPLDVAFLRQTLEGGRDSSLRLSN